MAIAISFNDYQNTGYLYTYDSTGAVFSANFYLTAAFDYFLDNAVAGDMIYFGFGGASVGPNRLKGVKFNVGTALVADAISIIWEYWSAEDNAWMPLANVVDDTNSFQNAGINTVTWDVPSNIGIEPIIVNGQVEKSWYRCRIVSVTNITEGGRQQTDYVQFQNYAIKITGAEITDDVFELAYQEDVSNGWGVMSKLSNTHTSCYYLDCSLIIASSTFRTKNQHIILGKDFRFTSSSIDWTLGDESLTGKAAGMPEKYGSGFYACLEWSGQYGIWFSGTLRLYGSRVHHRSISGGNRSSNHIRLSSCNLISHYSQIDEL